MEFKASYAQKRCKYCSTWHDNDLPGESTHEASCGERPKKWWKLPESVWNFIMSFFFLLALMFLFVHFVSAGEMSKTIHGDVFTAPALGEGMPPLRIMIVPAEDHYADVVFENQLVSVAETIGILLFQMDAGVVTVKTYQALGKEPDTMTVVPPYGYIAVPETVVVEENAVGIIELHQAALF